MNINKFTIKAQEAVGNAQSLAFEQQNQAIEPIHILLSLLDVDEHTVGYLLKKVNVNVATLREAARKKWKGWARPVMFLMHTSPVQLIRCS